MATANYYRLFALQPTATEVEIKQRYRQLSLTYHPDKGGRAQDMALINEAYSVLSNSLLRREYDKRYTTAQTTPTYSYAQPPYSSPEATYETVRRQRAAEERHYYQQPTAQPSHISSFWVWMVAAGMIAIGFLGYQFYAVVESTASATNVTSNAAGDSSGTTSPESSPYHYHTRHYESTRNTFQ